MPGISHGVTPVVDEIGKIHIEGNIIPPSWLIQLRTKKDKPHILAAMILGDIIYWYRPTIVRDEHTGQVIESRKKFSDDKLQRDARYYVRLFGCSLWQAQDALRYLEEQGLVTREYRDISLADGKELYHVPYIEPVPAKVAEITHRIMPLSANQRPRSNKPKAPVTPKQRGPIVKKQTPPSNKPRDTEITTETTSTEITPASSSSVVAVSPAATANKAAKDISPELSKDAHELLRDFYGVTYKVSRNKIIKNLSPRPDLMLRVIRQYGDEIQANHRLDEHYNCAGALVRVLCDLDMGMFVPNK